MNAGDWITIGGLLFIHAGAIVVGVAQVIWRIENRLTRVEVKLDMAAEAARAAAMKTGGQ